MTTDQRDDAAATQFGAYVHIPFCARVCPYCDFAVVAGRDDLTGRYLDALVTEIRRSDGPAIDALYIGGGTPSRLGPDGLRRVVGSLRDGPGLAPSAELSFESNPEDIDDDAAEGFRGVGFDRISIGVQSLDPATLEYLGRRHTPEDALAAIAAARRAGFRSVNVDLILGSPGETLDSWKRTVEAVLDAGVDHLSLYALTVELGTELSRSVAAGAAAPDPDTQADAWESGATAAEAAGLERYEVSNFARPGSECRYNLITWAQGEFHAFGNGAHRFRNGVRSWNVRKVEAYIDAVADGDPTSGHDDVSGWRAEQERLMLGLRRASGVLAGSGGAALLASEPGRRLVDAGVVALVGDRLVVQRPLLTDAAIREVLALEPVDC